MWAAGNYAQGLRVLRWLLSVGALFGLVVWADDFTKWHLGDLLFAGLCIWILATVVFWWPRPQEEQR